MKPTSIVSRLLTAVAAIVFLSAGCADNQGTPPGSKIEQPDDGTKNLPTPRPLTNSQPPGQLSIAAGQLRGQRFQVSAQFGQAVAQRAATGRTMRADGATVVQQAAQPNTRPAPGQPGATTP